MGQPTLFGWQVISHSQFNGLPYESTGAYASNVVVQHSSGGVDQHSSSVSKSHVGAGQGQPGKEQNVKPSSLHNSEPGSHVVGPIDSGDASSIVHSEAISIAVKGSMPPS